MAVVIAGLLLLGPARSLVFPGDDEAQPVDYSGVVSGFRTVAHVEPVVPTSVPDGWRANAARLTQPAAGPRLHIGWAVPGERFAGLDEAVGAPNALLRATLGTAGLKSVGTIDIGPHTWDVRRSQRGETALTRQVGSVAVVVTGDATDEELRALAGALR